MKEKEIERHAYIYIYMPYACMTYCMKPRQLKSEGRSPKVSDIENGGCTLNKASQLHGNAA